LEVIYQLDENGQVYTVVDAATTVSQAIITGLVTDEIFGAFAEPGLAITLTRDPLGSNTLANGMYAITGSLSNWFPQLTVAGYPVEYVLNCPGFQSVSMSVPVSSGSSFPIPAAQVAMRRLPVRVQGRVVDQVLRSPIANAMIRSIDDPLSPPAPHTTALRGQLYYAHAAGDSAQEVTINSTASANLSFGATGGDSALQLSTRSGLASGSLIRLSKSGGMRTEYCFVDHLGPGATATSGLVFLRHPLSMSYPVLGTAVDFVNAVPAAAPGTLSVAPDAGDGVLLASLLFNNTVSIDGGNPVAEIVDVGALSDADGYYAFSGIGRVATIVFQASAGAAQQTAEWYVEYDQPINIVDFRL
jgi:hypothetical protein